MGPDRLPGGMKKLPHTDDPRCLIARAMVDICRIAALHNEDTGAVGPAPHVEPLILLWTIYIGQCEGRPFSASKLEHYTGMPRATVMRKLAPYIDVGKVERKGQGFRLTEEWLEDPIHAKLIEDISAIFQVVGAKLTILGNHTLGD